MTVFEKSTFYIQLLCILSTHILRNNDYDPNNVTEKAADIQEDEEIKTHWNTEICLTRS